MTKGDEEAGGRGRYCSVKCNCWKMETNQNVLMVRELKENRHHYQSLDQS